MTADPEQGQPTTVPDRTQLIAGRYRLTAEIGGGAMGVVWRARDEVLGREVAVKELRPDSGMSGAQVKQSHLRARREGRIAARLQHPNAVTIYDVAEHDGRPYLIMEFVPSSTLADILATGTVLTPAEVARIGAQLASALAAAHDVGIVHRDIKPGNVLMTANGTVKLTDFGISRATGDATVTSTGEILGTPAYTAPEVAQGHAVDFPADVFSLGATLYAAVEGAPPFGDEVNAMAVLLRVVRNEIKPPKRAGMLTDIVLRMLSPEPADRPTMKEVRQALDALATSPLPVAGVVAAPAETKMLPVESAPPIAGPDLPSAAEPTPTSTAAEAGKALATEPESGPGWEPTPEPTPKPTQVTEKPLAVQPVPVPAPVPVPVADKPRAAEPETPPTAALPEASETRLIPEAAASATTGLRLPRRRLWFAGGAVGSVAVIVAVIIALSGGDHPAAPPVALSASTTSATPKPTPKSTPTPTPQTTSSSSASSSAAAPTSSASSPSTPTTSANPDVATQLASAITNYYSLVPGNLTQAWGAMMPSYQQNKALGFANYQKFWQSMQRVTVSDVVAKVPDTVTATIDYFPKSGAPTEERTVFTLVQDGGAWKIATSSVISSRNL